MSLNVLQKTLFRSFLRWNRRPEVVSSTCLSLPPLAIDALLPLSIRSEDLKTAEQTQAAIYHCFRHGTSNSKGIQQAFDALNALNSYSKVLSKRYDMTISHSNEENLKKIKYFIGDIVELNDSGVRGIVSGWKIHDNEQKVSLILDETDRDEFDDPRRGIINDVDLSMITPILEPELKRVTSRNTNRYFSHYDEKIGRFIPCQSLLTLYPRDFDVNSIQQTYGDLANENTKALERINQSLRSLTSEMLNVVERRIPGIFAYDNPLYKMVESDEEATRRYVAEEVLGGMLKDLAKLNRLVMDEQNNTKDNAKQNISTSSVIKNDDSQKSNEADPSISQRRLHHLRQQVTSETFRRRLVRGGAYRQQQNGDVEQITQQQAFNLLEKLTKELDATRKQFKDGLQLMVVLDQLMTHLELMLTLRFQSVGGLGKQYYLEPSKESDQLNLLRDISSPLAAKNEDADLKVLRENVQNLNTHPVSFSVGQVVRHSRYGFRGAILSCDIRPTIDTSSWDDVKHSALQQNQPFYKVIPDRGDYERIFAGAQLDVAFVYVPQDCLEEVPPVSAVIQNKELDSCFNGWDVKRKRFNVPQKLKYCFEYGPLSLSTMDAHLVAMAEKSPNGVLPMPQPMIRMSDAWDNWLNDRDNVEKAKLAGVWLEGKSEGTRERWMMCSSQVTDDMARIRRQEFIAYEAVDALMLELSSIYSGYFTSTRLAYEMNRNSPEDQSSQALQSGRVLDVKDVLNLLRQSQSRTVAMFLEQVLQTTWSAHCDPGVRSLLKQSNMQSVGKNLSESRRILQEVISECDPSFGEAYARLGSLEYAMNSGEEAEKWLEKALDVIPEHLNAKSCLSLTKESLNKPEESITLLRSVLQSHPWAVNMSTMLQSVRVSERKKQKELSESVLESSSEKGEVELP